jgi:multimeric flavodoxin WrbA
MSNVRDRPAQIKHLLDTLSGYLKQLTDWEKEFHASVKEQFRRKGDLSVKQMNRLEEIYTKYT